MSLAIRGVDGGVRIDVTVVPRAARTGLGGTRQGRLVLRVTAPPVDDAANEAVRALVARLVGVPRRAVTIVRGASARQKTLDVRGATVEAARRALNARAGTAGASGSPTRGW